MAQNKLNLVHIKLTEQLIEMIDGEVEKGVYKSRTVVINSNAGELHGTILAWTSFDAAFFLIVAFVIFGWLPLGKMVKFVRKIVKKGFSIISACGRDP